MVRSELEGLLLRAAARMIGRAVDVELLLALALSASALQVRLAVLQELLVVRELFVEHVRLDRALSTLTLSSNGFATLLRRSSGVRGRIVVARKLSALPSHDYILFLVLHLIDLLLHTLLLVAVLLVLHELLIVQVGMRRVLLLLRITLAHKVLLGILLLVLVQVLVRRVPAVLPLVLNILVLAAVRAVDLGIH